MRYTPNAVPEPTTRAELERIAHVLASPSVDRLEFKTWNSVPGRPEDGHVYLFAAGVVGASAGLYLYLAGTWTLL
jgi:hypothetical protein